MFQLHSIVLVLLLLISFALSGRVFGAIDSTAVTSLKKTSVKHYASSLQTFEGLLTTTPTSADPIVVPGHIIADSTNYFRMKALEFQQDVIDRQAYVADLNNLALLDLPVGLTSKGEDLNYAIIISQIRFNPRGATLEAYFVFKLPMTNDVIAFRGIDIGFSYEGGLTGQARLELLGNYPIKFNDNMLVTLMGGGKSFVTFNCDGFNGMGIDAQFEFSRDLIIPEDAHGNLIPSPARVKTSVAIQAKNWNDIMMGIDMPPFQMTGLKDVGFMVSKAYLDWSDVANPTGMIFPPSYACVFLEGDQPELWQGFYLQHLEVKLPRSFVKKDSVGRITIGANNMLIDDQGFSGSLFVEASILTLGDMNGWSYSIDRIGIELVTNQVKGFEMAGKLTIPVIKSKAGTTSQFGYLTQRNPDGNYVFAVKVETAVKIDLFVANVNLFQGSSVVVTERDDKFYPTAILNGELNISILGDGPKAVFNSIRFEGLRISSEAPHFDIQAIGFGKEGQDQSVSKYPLCINNIMLRKDNERIGIGFDVTINIGGKSDEGGFGGTAALVVWGKREKIDITSSEGEVTDTKEGNWKFDKVEISGIGISFKKPGVIEIAGMIRFFDGDPVYGDGFKGSISGKIQVIKLQVEALFGKTPSYRYWFADAMVEFSNGLPLVSGFSAYGFGGGFYSKMKQATSGSMGSPLGLTASGVTYVPDENTFGIKAMVKFGCTGSQMPYNGDVTLEVELNRHGGINSVTFTGNLRALTPPPIVQQAMMVKDMIAAAVDGGGDNLDKFMDPSQGAVFAHVKIFFDNVNHIFHANMEMYINVAFGIVKGVGAGNRAGWAVMHFEKNDWYVLIGTPDDPVGLEILWLLKMRSYFMLGKHLPGSPSPPKQVSDILGITSDQLDYMRDLNAIESGLGFAFGLNFSMDTGDLRFLMFYGNFSAGIGTDFMIKQYAKEYHCEGSEGPIGINGWYANGQAYAYVQGKIGISVRLKFYRGDFDILSIGAAAILQTKAPNPFWMRGMVGGYYNILGGLVKGKCNFEFEIGKDCKLIKEQPDAIVAPVDPLADMKIISSLTPVTDEKNVDIFTAPQAIFNIPIGDVFDLKSEDGKPHLFRGRLESFQILADGNPMPGNVTWNDAKDVAAFDAFEVLPSEKELKAIVKVIFEENIDGQWHPVNFEGNPSEETVEVVFTTGTAPTSIPSSNVDISYPAVGHFNFYPKEYNQGFIELKKGQAYLFTPDEEWIKKLHFTDGSQNYLETAITYNEKEKRIYFSIPQGLQNEKAYTLELLNVPKRTGSVGENVKSTDTKVLTSDGNELSITVKTSEGNLEIRDVKCIYSSLFRTSKYNTFREKVSSIALSKAFKDVTDGNVFRLVSYIKGTELFDKAEIAENFVDRALQFEAVIDRNTWYQNDVYPLVYDGFPLVPGMAIRFRDPTDYGFPPVKAVFIDQAGYAPSYNDKSCELRFNAPSLFNGIRYDLMIPMASDYYEIQNQVANYVVNSKSSELPKRFISILSTTFPALRHGKYTLRLNYIIPRIKITTSTYEWELSNAADN
jgi:hypothetical protein